MIPVTYRDIHWFSNICNVDKVMFKESFKMEKEKRQQAMQEQTNTESQSQTQEINLPSLHEMEKMMKELDKSGLNFGEETSGANENLHTKNQTVETKEQEMKDDRQEMWYKNGIIQDTEINEKSTGTVETVAVGGKEEKDDTDANVIYLGQDVQDQGEDMVDEYDKDAYDDTNVAVEADHIVDEYDDTTVDVEADNYDESDDNDDDDDDGHSVSILPSKIGKTISQFSKEDLQKLYMKELKQKQEKAAKLHQHQPSSEGDEVTEPPLSSRIQNWTQLPYIPEIDADRPKMKDMYDMSDVSDLTDMTDLEEMSSSDVGESEEGLIDGNSVAHEFEGPFRYAVSLGNSTIPLPFSSTLSSACKGTGIKYCNTHITPHHTTSHHITPHHTTSHHTTPHHTTSTYPIFHKESCLNIL